MAIPFVVRATLPVMRSVQQTLREAAAVLAGRVRPALDRALAVQHPLALEAELHALAARELLLRSGVSTHRFGTRFGRRGDPVPEAPTGGQQR